ncbi:MAG: modification methylase [Acidimicrobiales bacterium]|nr:modification methylase [Acidimicrobiales bacterium]
MVERKRGTSTSNFGVGKRESHDASAFYARFEAPRLSDDATVLDPALVDGAIGDPLKAGDARAMTDVPDGAVALVVTSPPYFAGKQYEEELGQGGIPASYAAYLDMLEAVFAECVRTLEPGGRIAVNVANLGRKPYRSLAADVIQILQDRLHLLMRGEVVWQKQEGASGNCAWGSYRSPANPTIRDLTERVVIASKGRFDRAMSAKRREVAGLPYRPTINADRFMAATTDVWSIPPESAKRVGHPAPFPVELPEWLIDLYTYENDLVLDPFLGSGSSAVAAARTNRRFVGYDLDPAYVAIARQRLKDEHERLAEEEERRAVPSTPPQAEVPASDQAESASDFQRRASLEGKAAQALAEQVLTEAGFTIIDRNHRLRGLGMTMNFRAVDQAEDLWLFDVSGAFSSTRGGLRRTDTMWKALGRAHVLARNQAFARIPLVLLTSHLPHPSTDGERAMHAAGPNAFFDAIAMLEADDFGRLRSYASGGFGGGRRAPVAGFWAPGDLDAWKPPPDVDER